MLVPSPIYTIGHGRRPIAELVDCLRDVEVATLIDVRRHPFSRRNPQFNQPAVTAALEDSGIEYVHAVELGGLREDVPDAELFPCLGQFASYAAHMRTREWRAAIDEALARPAPCFMCAETPWLRCHRRFVSELLVARGFDVVHLIRPGEREPHRIHPDAAHRGGVLYLCGEPVG
jgi:uncharacterized protein (DUF488 family)